MLYFYFITTEITYTLVIKMVLIEQVLFDFAYHDYWRYKFVLVYH